jgi:prepilin-type N-terminal cleavage/methylation domain-containing protein
MKRRALSLLEMIVALSLAGLVLLFVLDLFPGSLIGLRHSEARTSAAALAQGALETAQAQSYDQLAVGSSTPLPGRTMNGLDYTLTLEVFAVPGNDPQRLKGLREGVAGDGALGLRRQSSAAGSGGLASP